MHSHEVVSGRLGPRPQAFLCGTQLATACAWQETVLAGMRAVRGRAVRPRVAGLRPHQAAIRKMNARWLKGGLSPLWPSGVAPGPSTTRGLAGRAWTDVRLLAVPRWSWGMGTARKSWVMRHSSELALAKEGAAPPLRVAPRSNRSQRAPPGAKAVMPKVIEIVVSVISTRSCATLPNGRPGPMHAGPFDSTRPGVVTCLQMRHRSHLSCSLPLPTALQLPQHFAPGPTHHPDHWRNTRPTCTGITKTPSPNPAAANATHPGP